MGEEHGMKKLAAVFAGILLWCAVSVVRRQTEAAVAPPEGLIVEGVPAIPAGLAGIVAALTKAGTPGWYIMAKDEGHGFQKKANQDYQFYATVEFLQQYLLK